MNQECAFSGCSNPATRKVTPVTDCGCAHPATTRLSICDDHPARAPRPTQCANCRKLVYRYLIPN